MIVHWPTFVAYLVGAMLMTVGAFIASNLRRRFWMQARVSRSRGEFLHHSTRANLCGILALVGMMGSLGTYTILIFTLIVAILGAP